MMNNTTVISNRRWTRVLIACCAVSGTHVLASPADGLAAAATESSDTSKDVGEVVVVDPYKQADALTRGEATTEFSLRLPEGSTCPGDSANDQWRVQSFIIPAQDDPVGIRYGAIGPEPVGPDRYAMFNIDTRPFVHQLLQPNPAAGQPGVISVLPPFSFEVVAGEDIPPGRYRIGVACTFFGDTAQYWDTEIVLDAPASGEGSQLSWRLPSVAADAVQSSDQGSGRWLVLAGGGLVAAAIGLYVWRGKSRQPLTLSKESP